MTRFLYIVTICILLSGLLTVSALYAQQDTGVTAEAIGQANLRAEPSIEAEVVGEIIRGTRYPVVGRSDVFPWVLLGDSTTFQPIGWVFQDLVSIIGNMSNVPVTDIVVNPSASAVPPTPTAGLATGAPFTATATVSTAPIATATSVFRVSGLVNGEINIRYGPGIEFDRLGVAQAGDRFEVTRWHTQLPWVEIVYENSPNGHGWVAIDLLDIDGDIFSLPSLSVIPILPTLTPTQPVIESGGFLGHSPVPLSAGFRALGNQIWEMMLAAGFDPQTSRFGAIYVLDLQTGEAFTFGNNIAFSGMSINKIPVLTHLYSVLQAPPDSTEALTIANMMICSENTSTNAVLSWVGGGDEYVGAANVSAYMNAIGLERTFIVAPYTIPNVSTPRPVILPETSADQISANPDPSNQFTVDEMGWLLGSVYQCAMTGSGPLMEGDLAGSFTQRECQSMMRVMSENRIGALIEAGVPAGTFVAHKHGWVDEMHGDAGIVMSPGGDYVIVMVFRNPVWLEFTDSFPLMAEISRTVYNYFNPDAPMTEIRDEVVSETCEIPGDLLIDLTAP